MTKNTELLREQTDLKGYFDSWFAGEGTSQSLKSILEDNRRRYRMELADAEERTKRGLSALPSTKTTSVVDNFVEDAYMEYHGEDDAISYTAKNNLNKEHDELAKWLTEVVKYRMNNTFNFDTYHLQTLKDGAVDGMEAALISWRKEEYYEGKAVYYFGEGDDRVEIPEEVYNDFGGIDDSGFSKETYKEPVVVTDTWWIDQLKPGENLLWDWKNPILDLNCGEWALVFLPKTVTEIEKLATAGVFDKIKPKKVRELLRPFQKPENNEYTDSDMVSGDPDADDTDEYNRVKLWVFFKKVDCRWMCSFSIDGELELSDQKPVNDVFFAGRRVDRLPVVLGCNDFELWQPIGRGIPKLIAPIEDEIIDAKNNANDLSKQIVQGKHRVRPSADIDIDSLLNSRVFYAEEGDVETMQLNPGYMEALRQGDSLAADLHELVPATMGSKNFIPKGQSKTLGHTQIAMQDVNKKLSIRLLVRNITFMRPLLYLIAQMEFAYETDELILRIAASQTKLGQRDGQDIQFQPPEALNEQQQPVIDLEKLDFPVNVKINAGLGSIPKHQKSQGLMQISDYRAAHKVPTDFKKVSDQLCTLNGFAPDQFDLKEQPQPKPPEVQYKANVTVDLAMLPEQVQQLLLDKMLKSGDITANVKKDTKAAKQREEMEGALTPMLPQREELPESEVVV